MAFVGIENRIKSGDNEYLLKSSNDVLGEKITSALFMDGNIINIIDYDYSENGNHTRVGDLVHDIHAGRKEYIERLIDFASNIPPSMDNSLWRDRLGLGFLGLNMLQEAEREFKKAIEHNSEYSVAYCHLGQTMIRMRRDSVAAGYFEIAVAGKPDYADFHLNLAEAYLKIGRCKDSVGAADRALEINVYFARAYYVRALGLLLNSANREDFELSKNCRENAKNDLLKAISINPGLKGEEFDRALDLLSQDRLKETYNILQVPPAADSSEELSRTKLETYIKLASSLDTVTEDEIREYICYLEKKQQENPHFADLHNELGAAYTVLARLINDKASEHYKNALDVNPSYEAALKNLKLTENEARGTELLLRAVLGSRDLQL